MALSFLPDFQQNFDPVVSRVSLILAQFLLGKESLEEKSFPNIRVCSTVKQIERL
jgi:hypothetical protein